MRIKPWITYSINYNKYFCFAEYLKNFFAAKKVLNKEIPVENF